MDRSFVKLLMDKTGFPGDAKKEILRCTDNLISAGLEGEFDALLKLYADRSFRSSEVEKEVMDLACKAGFCHYTLWLLLLIHAARDAKPVYEKRGVNDELFWVTMSDLKYKVDECHEIYGVWGNFVAFWYPIFFICNIVKLGRLEFESCEYPLEEPYICGDVVVRNGDPVLSIHIPSSGESFDREARMDAYHKAFSFFGRKPLVCFCHSWLLYPPYWDLLQEGSNIRSFMDDFDVIRKWDEDHFGDAWRLFGRDSEKKPEELPEDTSMQRSFKRYLCAGGKTGEGFGVLIFDGEKIINK